VFPGKTIAMPDRSTDTVRLEPSDQVLIAAISGPTPKIVIIRFRLSVPRSDPTANSAAAAPDSAVSDGRRAK